jgi:hypothetical protein
MVPLWYTAQVFVDYIKTSSITQRNGIYENKKTDHEAPHYEVFSTPLLPRPS